MEAYQTAVKNVLRIYIEKASEMETQAGRMACIEGLFTYISTAGVKPLLQTESFAAFRNILLKKIHEFSNNAAGKQNYRLQAVMRELFSYLVQDDSVCPRRSERQKEQAVRRFNARFEGSSRPGSESIAEELRGWSAVTRETAYPANIKVKVLPRRSGRLLARGE